MRTRVRHAVTAFTMAASLLMAVSAAHAQAPPQPWPIRAVIVTTFEIGADTGDIPGEFQFWVEREQLTEAVPFPRGVHARRMTRRSVKS